MKNSWIVTICILVASLGCTNQVPTKLNGLDSTTKSLADLKIKDKLPGKSVEDLDPMKKAWNNHDTNYFRSYILHLKDYNFPELANKLYNLAIQTGFGWGLVSPYNLYYQRNDTSNNLEAKNFIKGFEIYMKSRLFMRQIGYSVVCRYFRDDNTKILSEEEEGCLLRFANDIADSTFYYYYKPMPLTKLRKTEVVTVSSEISQMREAWANKDTNYFKNYIINLYKDSFPKLAIKLNNLSQITNFGWAYPDPSGPVFQKNNKSNRILKKNMARGFKLYMKSELFMHKLSSKVDLLRYFHYDNTRLLLKDEESRLLWFANDIADSSLYYYYVKH